MIRAYLIIVILHLCFIFQGCTALEYLDGSSKEEIKKFKMTKDQMWNEMEKFKIENVKLKRQISLGEEKLQNEMEKFKIENVKLKRQISLGEEKLQVEKSLAKAKTEELESTYDSLISVKRQLKNKEMTIREFEEKLSITFVDRILFDFGKTTITPEGKRILRRVGEILKNVHGMQIKVVGHTDNRPIRKKYQYKFPSNWELSSARAAAVVRYFEKKVGLDPRNLEAMGRSFYDSVASNETAEGRAQNRRVEIIIAPKIE